MGSNTILILGGGVGGLVTANELRKALPSENRIVLIEKNSEHAFAPSFLWLMVGDREPRQITRPVQDLLQPGVDLKHGEISGISSVDQTVEVDGESLSYDHLVIALGADLFPDAVVGLKESAHTFYSFEGAKKLRQALESFREGTVAVVVSAMPYKCPGAPYEGAMLIADYFRRLGLKDKVKVCFYTPEPQPMPVAGPELGKAVTEMLVSNGIACHPLHQLTSVDAQNGKLTFEGKEHVAYDLLVAIPPHKSPAVVKEAGLTNDAGWIPVNQETLETEHNNVYAIGDITSLPIPGRWKPDIPMMLPKAGVFAHAQAKVVVQRIVANINGKDSEAVFSGDGYCMLEAGKSVAGFAFGNFYAEPTPQVELRELSKTWHIGKVMFEKWWLAPFGLKRSLLGQMLKTGGKFLGIKVDL